MAGDPTFVSQLSLDNGRAITRAAVPGQAWPVASTETGLLLNTSDLVGVPPAPGMFLVTPDGSVRELWPGRGLGLSPLGQVTWLDCDDGDRDCRIVVSVLDGPAPDDLVIEFNDSWVGALFQPGVSQVSPNGAWLVTTIHAHAANADTPFSIMLVNLRDGSLSILHPGVPLGSRPGPGVVWSEESDWVFITAAGPTAIRIADGLAVDLHEWIPTDMHVYAVASR